MNDYIAVIKNEMLLELHRQLDLANSRLDHAVDALQEVWDGTRPIMRHFVLMRVNAYANNLKLVADDLRKVMDCPDWHFPNNLDNWHGDDPQALGEAAQQLLRLQRIATNLDAFISVELLKYEAKR